MSAPIKHEETRISAAAHFRAVGIEMVSSCSCGARWSHPQDRPVEVMDSIFASHLKYFERETVVL